MTGWACVRGLATLSVCFSLLVGCGGSTNGSPSSSPTTPATAGTATLLPSVKMIDSTQADYVTSSTDTTWTLRTASSVQPGDVLLLQDAAVKVVSVDTSSGQVVLTVTPAQIEDVFSKLSLQQTLDLSNATFTPDPASQIPATFTSSTAGSSAAVSSTASPISGSGGAFLTIPYKSPPFSAALTFKLLGAVSLDYDSSQNTGITGKLDVTGIVDENVSMSSNGAITAALPELSVGTLRIPLPLSVVDSVLRVVGIRVASIYIPVSVGAQATTSFAIDVSVNGTAQANMVTNYDSINGFSVSGPVDSATLTLTGIPPTTTPLTAVSGSLEAGPYVHAMPQLLILNQVASIGADVKVGLYGQGTMQSILSSPYYCLNLQGKVEGSAFGFFKGVGVGSYQSKAVTQALDVGPPFVYGSADCTTGVQFSAPTYSVIPTAGNATITVTRTGDTSAAATVQYATSDGTALAGQDYTATSGTLTFNPTDTSATFTIPILNNTAAQSDRTVNLTLSQPSTGTVLGTQSTAVLTISMPSSVQFTLSTYTVNQTAGIASIAVTRTGDTSAAATVQYATSDGTAVAGQDYTATSGTLTFNPFDTAMSFDIPILSTGQGGTVNLTLSQPSTGTVLGTQSTAVLTIQPANNPWVGTWVGSVTSTCGYYSGPLTYTITSGGGTTLNISYDAAGGGSFTATYSGNSATSTNGAILMTLNGNLLSLTQDIACQTATFTRQ